MARKRETGVTLPEGVETKTIRKKSGKAYTYYYWNPGRNTDREGERIKLPDAIKHPARFFAEVERRLNSLRHAAEGDDGGERGGLASGARPLERRPRVVAQSEHRPIGKHLGHLAPFNLRSTL